MSKFTNRHHGIALLMVMLLVGSATFTGWGKSLAASVAFDAHISEVTLGTDKEMTEETDEFEADETIFAAVEIEEYQQNVRVKGRLRIVEVAGQNPGPISGTEVIVNVKGEDTADFKFSSPTKGWPLGKYAFDALLIDVNGRTLDSESHEFIVH